ncbi:MAG: DNA polymerase III subunit delta' [Pseudomonadota bacterium]
MTADAAWPLIGHSESEKVFVDALQSDRMHHGWLLEGPSGIGKSLLAKRMAARVLGAATEGKSLDTTTSDPVVQKILADGHPDFRWVSRRADEKGKVKQDIPVDTIRELNHFFALKPALGGWRVGVIDSLDELNASGANALLKTLEEPPAKCLIVLISHNTKPVLPTIRSRCRLLRLRPLDKDQTQSVLKQISDEQEIDPAAADLAGGRPGRGMQLASSSGLAALNATKNYLRGLPRPSDTALAEVIARGGSDQMAFEAMSYAILDWLETKTDGAPEVSSIWLDCSRLLADVRELNMDYGQAAAKLAATLQNGLKAR